MENIPEAATWRDLLAKLIEDLRERERIATAARVQPITLVRWTKGISQPHTENMRLLLKSLPSDVYPSFMHLIADDFPDLAQARMLDKQVQAVLPPEFYERVLRAHAELPRSIHSHVLSDLVLQQAIQHLDPDKCGMLISITNFVRPLNGLKVRSMREISGIGTPPWEYDRMQKTLLLGAESLAGYAVTQLHRAIVPNRTDFTFFPVHWTEYEQSAVAVPIMRRGKVAGSLLAASATPDYFLRDSSLSSILEKYAHLASLIFEEEEFFDPSEIALGYMPPYELQAPYFRDFNRLILQRLRLAQVRNGHYTLEDARRQVWREIEEELLQVFLHTMSSK